MICSRYILAAAAAFAFAASTPAHSLQPMEPQPPHETPIPFPALADWPADVSGFSARLASMRAHGAKAATDRAAVFRPLPPCRLVDTRGYPAAIALPGPLAANSTTSIDAAGNCGIPDNFNVVGLSVSITFQNLTPNAGGYIATQQQGQPVTAVNTVLNFGAEWTGTTGNIPIPNGSGDFSVHLANSSGHIVFDVNGYFQDVNNLDVGTQELDIYGATTGEVFGVQNTLSGVGVGVTNSAVNGTAIRATATNGVALSMTGALRAPGAGVGSNTFATVHQVITGAVSGAGGTMCTLGTASYSVLDHPMTNNDSSAIIIVTPRLGASGQTTAAPIQVRYVVSGCDGTANQKWMIHRVDGTAHVNGARFNVLIIKD